MKSLEQESADLRAIRYKQIRDSKQCYCGRFKWPGFSFCRRCISKLPENLKTDLYRYREIGQGYEQTYDACIKVLKAAGVRSYKETGKLG